MNISIIGAGLIGRSWAIVFARAGHSVQVWDQNQQALDGAQQLIAQQLDPLRALGLLDCEPQFVLDQIRIRSSLEQALDSTDYVQENLPETTAVKEHIFTAMDALCPEHVVLASSTSSIPASVFSKNVRYRHRCVVAHPVNPPHLIPVVEVCGAPWTSPEVVQLTMELMREVKQKPVLLNQEIEGFVLNRLQGAVLNEAFKLVQQGYMSVEDIDTTVKDGLGLRWAFMGPFETIDLNAPGGLADYCQRYGGLYESIASQQSGVKPWTNALIGQVAAERQQILARDQLAQRNRWRDKKLIELVALKKTFDLDTGE